jgi:hypothetical protein
MDENGRMGKKDEYFSRKEETIGNMNGRAKLIGFLNFFKLSVQGCS